MTDDELLQSAQAIHKSSRRCDLVELQATGVYLMARYLEESSSPKVRAAAVLIAEAMEHPRRLT